ncbi:MULTISPECIES: methionine--tRNA ligase [Flavobacterium]|jgi:methionyl-tRNA synthetase|uniref:Methionine--tRNA ligase n=1 Tax=Flavobacterium johnsoniae (strain ATCC 17061 / DSM 2064 / JCM 8514 / BCRC 14874 / CCUG 350202 / NBRC 14942 / NCIMB 11054 / UW101) TaxID=376686 RepID=SYM_FLAJ1|nr:MULTISPECIES: methionine--tRNA ligase [Flavobacterium]A5FLM7.1 RecName: Full=Methionine--tRNA ligase; AltName: Full=Methionyl-tRNA synthetase; Short=MetRS [Flavobacterium johnsoniae UW101]ABQ03891.1 methionyl-tRNA synthetase [Flavobacterium johnsoniae UW101]OXE96239.1 methionine--tRNA ligase [Flavobacterium johnsoniae UW101]WDF59618.1 methionine--tRNA ligase [Flavobacterium sp. KACC 22758]WQG79244.1 methionine--tRNA ligase [Flavobacterium johnsoniae UW101]SHK05767.1 methionyl-tRNA syntheta
MTQNPKRYTITAALPYTNGPIHIGHLAGVYVPADIYSRYLRLQGKDVAFICGSDEHGVAISMKAKKEGVTPQEVIDKYDGIIRKSFADFGISFNNYSRTSAKIHHDTASEFFRTLYDKGDFIEEVTEQLYDAKANQFLADRFVVGTCPKCDNPEAYGDQCEKCGSTLNATDLINPKSTITGETPILKETKHWFLPLDRYSDFLTKWILEGHKNDWKPNVYGQVKSWIDGGLEPRAVTRDLDWGIDVPVEGAEGKKLYVWFDAPIGYISSTKEWAAREGKDWEPYWKDEETKLVHFIGKDNIVFHCIIFPAMLKAEGSYILPDNVPANEFLNLEGNKLSTSKNWAVWLHEYLEEFPDKQDVLRYALTSNAPETKDNDFTWKDFQARNNNELVAIFGNFVNRVVVLTNKYYDGVIPTPNEFTEIDEQTLAELKAYPAVISSSVERYRFREALGELMNVARLGNKYLADEEPWKVMKDNPERVKTQMYVALQIAAALSVLAEPFLPFTAAKLSKILNLGDLKEHFEGFSKFLKERHQDANDIIIDKTLGWNDISENSDLIPAGHKIGEAELLFAKIEDEEIQKQIDKLEATKTANIAENQKAEPQKDLIQFEDFAKMDIRIGTILEAEKMPKANKLLVLKVDTGIDVRTIVSGIAESFSPEEIIGKRVSVLANLAPRALRGVESQGMILMTTNAEGKLVFVNPDADAPNGATVN